MSHDRQRKMPVQFKPFYLRSHLLQSTLSAPPGRSQTMRTAHLQVSQWGVAVVVKSIGGHPDCRQGLGPWRQTVISGPRSVRQMMSGTRGTLMKLRICKQGSLTGKQDRWRDLYPLDRQSGQQKWSNCCPVQMDYNWTKHMPNIGSSWHHLVHGPRLRQALDHSVLTGMGSTWKKEG